MSEHEYEREQNETLSGTRQMWWVVSTIIGVLFSIMLLYSQYNGQKISSIEATLVQLQVAIAREQAVNISQASQVDDVKKTLTEINAKLDRLLMGNQKERQ